MSTALLTVFSAIQISLCAHSRLPVVIIQVHLCLLPVVILKLCDTSARDKMIEDLPPSVTSKLYVIKLATLLSQWPSWFCTFVSHCYENLSFSLSPCSGGTNSLQSLMPQCRHLHHVWARETKHTSLGVKQDYCSHWSSGQLSQKNISHYFSHPNVDTCSDWLNSTPKFVQLALCLLWVRPRQSAHMLVSLFCMVTVHSSLRSTINKWRHAHLLLVFGSCHYLKKLVPIRPYK